MRSSLRVLVAALAAASVPAAAADRPIGDFFDELARDWVRNDPQRATALQFFEGAEQDALDRRLTPITDEYRRGQIAAARRGLQELHGYDRQRLTPAERISYAALEWQLDDVVREEPFLDHSFPFEQFGGVQRRLPDFLASTHPVRNLRDAENYLARLEAVGPVIDDAIAVARGRAQRGFLPPAFILRATIGQMERFVAPPPARNLLVTSLAERLGRLKDVSAADRDRLVQGAARTVEASVYPAWQRALVVLREQLPRATEDAGLWRLPAGDAAYRHFLRRFTTVEMTPDEVHALGLQQVARLEGEMDGLLKSLGFATGPIPERMRALAAAAPSIADPDPRAVVLKEYERIVRDAEARCRALFDLTPRAPVEVRREPEFSEANAAAHYTAPAPDGSLPGIFWVPLPGPTFRSGDVRRSLAYHEAVPGHHFQIALQQENTALPRFRRDRALGILSSFAEGWALYAERLAAEQGWYDGDARGRLGQLDSELFRARRLVVDTGLHAKHWTRQQAIDYGMPANEVERYVVFPGQACAYMVGELRIIALRDRMKAALGERFSLRDFHRLVLQSGTLPLDVLGQVVDDAVAAAGPGHTTSTGHGAWRTTRAALLPSWRSPMASAPWQAITTRSDRSAAAWATMRSQARPRSMRVERSTPGNWSRSRRQSDASEISGRAGPGSPTKSACTCAPKAWATAAA
jgi:uncharacterized protein (DUF885 family)